jgi:MAP/microtubule affinity-regulating kinase
MLKRDEGLVSTSQLAIHPLIRRIRLFGLKGGIELMNGELMESVTGQHYLFYSLQGEGFDHQVRMEFINFKKKLGEGGFGSVFLAHDQLINKEVAIKVLNFSQQTKNSHMITKEVEALGKLRHKNIVKLYDNFPLPNKQQFIVVMEFLQGGELDELWKYQPSRRFREKDTHSLFTQMLSAIDYCHYSQIIHRDLKFQNVLLARPPVYNDQGKIDIESVELKVVDFGIFGSIAGIRMENITCGSLRYMAPEILQGRFESTPKIDIWSLGVMLHALALGFFPFNSSNKVTLEQQILTQELEYKALKKKKTASIKNEQRREINRILKTISDPLIDLIEGMLMKDPEKRFDKYQIYDHPWVEKYTHKVDSIDHEEIKDSDVSQSLNGSDDGLTSEGFESHNSNTTNHKEEGEDKLRVTKNGTLDKMPMFDIEELENETTGNISPVKFTNLIKRGSKLMRETSSD